MHIVHNARVTLLATALNSLPLAVMAIEIPPPGVGSNTWLKQCGLPKEDGSGWQTNMETLISRQHGCVGRGAAPCSTRCGVID